MSAHSIDAIELLCPDVALTSAFYEKALGARRVTETALQIGEETIRFAPTLMKTTRLSPGNATSFQHFAIAVSNIDAAMARLSSVPGWKPISTDGPVQLPLSSGGVTAFKFRDPDGHPLELLAFPVWNTPDRWVQSNGIFLGIDHTAISIENTRRSVEFYDSFGFSAVSQTINCGAEQARLDGLNDPEVEVTALVQSDGKPHLELLCYRQPKACLDARGEEDILSTRIRFGGFSAGISRKDPDGHRISAD